MIIQLCTLPRCTFVATHQQENLKDSIPLGKIAGTYNFYCSQHAPIFIDLYQQAEEHRKVHPGISKPFGPVVLIPKEVI